MRRLLLVATLFAAVALAACGGTTATLPEPSASDPQSVQGRALVESKCLGCHDAARIVAKQSNAAGWQATVMRMEGKGVQLTDEERSAIIAYLSAIGANQ